MYLAEIDTDFKSLYQGDIIKDVQILGAININSIYFNTQSIKQDENPKYWSVQTPPRIGDVIVLSHSCEIAIENGVKLTSIILAPLRDIHTATDKSKIDELIRSNLIDKDSYKFSYLKYFYLEKDSSMKYAKGSVADFSKCFSLRKQSYEHLLSNKVLQLNDETRNSMSLKLALYFHRSN